LRFAPRGRRFPQVLSHFPPQAVQCLPFRGRGRGFGLVVNKGGERFLCGQSVFVPLLGRVTTCPSVIPTVFSVMTVGALGQRPLRNSSPLMLFVFAADWPKGRHAVSCPSEAIFPLSSVFLPHVRPRSVVHTGGWVLKLVFAALTRYSTTVAFSLLF